MAKVNYGALLCAESSRIKNFDDFWYFFGPARDHCDAGIRNYSDIANKPSCLGNISDLYDIIGVEYYELCGKHICELPSANHLEKNELILLTRYVNANTLSSMNMTYGQLSDQMFVDVLCGLHVGSMAYEPKYRYAISSHNHDTIYSRVTYQRNTSNTDVSTIGTLTISTDALQAGCQYDNVNHNPARKISPIPTVVHNINIPKIYVPFPPRPIIGTLKFVGLQTVQKLIDTNSLVVINGTHQVNPYNNSNKIRNTYDGWVFANGTTIANNGSQLSGASQVYNGNNTGNITVPELTSFFKCNPNIYSAHSIQKHDFKHVIAQHQHNFNQCNVEGDLTLLCAFVGFNHGATDGTGCSKGKTFEESIAGFSEEEKTILRNFNAKFGPGCHWHDSKGTAVQNVQVTVNPKDFIIPGLNIHNNENGSNAEQYPTHNIVPIMVYIGGETREYYEYIYLKYHGKIF